MSNSTSYRKVWTKSLIRWLSNFTFCGPTPSKMFHTFFQNNDNVMRLTNSRCSLLQKNYFLLFFVALKRAVLLAWLLRSTKVDAQNARLELWHTTAFAYEMTLSLSAKERVAALPICSAVQSSVLQETKALDQVCCICRPWIPTHNSPMGLDLENSGAIRLWQ